MTQQRNKENTLPRHVVEVKNYLTIQTKHRHASVASKLIGDDPELVKMWSTLEKQSPRPDGYYDNLWVWMFLSAATTASKRPRYELLSKKARESLITSIDELATELSRKLVDKWHFAAPFEAALERTAGEAASHG